jgi:hypothetical protein
MIIANLTEMLNHKFDEIYEYRNHQWINEQLNCGCIIAICVDIEPEDKDADWTSKQFKKIASLQTFLREAVKSSDENISNKIEKFQKELEEAQNFLANFIKNKRKKHAFPNGTDFNSEWYFIKLQKSASCNNSM